VVVCGFDRKTSDETSRPCEVKLVVAFQFSTQRHTEISTQRHTELFHRDAQRFLTLRRSEAKAQGGGSELEQRIRTTNYQERANVLC
jgi:hypothetical protein